MRSAEIDALGRLAGQVFAHPSRIAGDVHGAVARRTFGALGLIGLPTRLVHDAISSATYRSVGMALRAPLAAGAAAVANGAPPDASRLSDSTAGGMLLGALNGAVGDRLARRYPDLAVELSIRRGGRDVALDASGLTHAFPDATPKLAVFVHGLCGDENTWHLLPIGAPGEPRRSYGARLRAELGYTPIYVRYNTGLHISDNGRRLAETLERLVAAWPVDVERLVLVGHSMGGLVCRSACHYGDASDHDWVPPLRHVICLGTPHLGAPLEKAANVAGWALTRAPEVEPFGALVNGRSAGIKDLRFGSCVEEDWCDCDADEFLRDRCQEVPFLRSATYCFIGATVARSADGPLGRLVGDLLVLYPSASGEGRRRRIPFESENGLYIGGVNHIQLLNHPAIYERISTWLESTPAS